MADKVASLAVARTLSWLRERRYRPVHLLYREKTPRDGGWSRKDYQPSDDAWGSPSNIGCILGPARGGPVDVDLDCQEAIALAPFFLPSTEAVFGRKSKPNSHYLYEIAPDHKDPCPTCAFRDPKSTAPMLELRADASEGEGAVQTVMPGSINPSSEPVEWSVKPNPTPAVVAYADLHKAVSRLAFAVLCLRHLWLDGQRHEACMHLSGSLLYAGWSLDDIESLVDALTQAGGGADKSLIATVRSSGKRFERNARMTGWPHVRQMVKNDDIVDAMIETAGARHSSFIMEYNENFAVTLVGSKVRVANLSVEPSHPPVFMQMEDFHALCAADLVEDGDGKSHAKSRIWFSNRRRRVHLSVSFMPGVADAGASLNLWTGWATPPAEGSCSAWLDLLRVICGAEAAFDWVLSWFANIVREPMQKSRTALAIWGEQGAGKSLLVNYFGRILGDCYITLSNAEHVYGKFNGHLANKLLIHSEEAVYAGDKKHQSIIKSLITDVHNAVEQKFSDVVTVRNYARVLLTSNDPRVAPIERNDRRFTIIDVDDRRAAPELVRRVLQEMDAGGPAALHQYLLDIDYDPDTASTPLPGEARKSLKEQNLDPISRWWFDRLSEGVLFPDLLNWAYVGARDDEQSLDWPREPSSRALYWSYSAWGRERPAGDVAFWAQMEKMCGIKFRKQLRSIPMVMDLKDLPREFGQWGERTKAVLNFPPLQDCRAAFDKWVGHAGDWPTDGPRDEARERKY